jgi:multisubunit Na+/H+ antiporter MnhC subunit
MARSILQFLFLTGAFLVCRRNLQRVLIQLAVEDCKTISAKPLEKTKLKSPHLQ